MKLSTASVVVLGLLACVMHVAYATPPCTLENPSYYVVGNSDVGCTGTTCTIGREIILTCNNGYASTGDDKFVLSCQEASGELKYSGERCFPDFCSGECDVSNNNKVCVQTGIGSDRSFNCICAIGFTGPDCSHDGGCPTCNNGNTCCPGPQGPQGVSGKDGKDGKDGTGKDGKDGNDGTEGPQGVSGKDGKDGRDGTNGAGTDGKDGKDGNDGTGTDGKDGHDGKDGKDGNDGNDGVQGPQGPKGDPAPAYATYKAPYGGPNGYGYQSKQKYY